MTVTLRPAETNEIALLDPMVEAYHAFEEITLPPEARRAAVRALLKAPESGRVYLIEKDGVTMGYAALTFGFSIELGGRDAFVDEYFVLPEHRGQGVGSAALSLLLKEAELAGVRALHLEVGRENNRARALYGRLGFQGRERFHLMTWKP